MNEFNSNLGMGNFITATLFLPRIESPNYLAIFHKFLQIFLYYRPLQFIDAP